MLENTLLTLILLLPLTAAFVALLVPKSLLRSIKIFTLGISLLTLVISLFIFSRFKISTGIQFEHKIEWLKHLGIEYYVGIDGISIFLLLLTTFFIPVAILSTWQTIKGNEKIFYASILALEGYLIGSVISLNMFVFYIFWELMLIPVFFMIGLWGESKNLRITVKFFIYTMIGSLGMLFSMLYMYYQHFEQYGFYSFNIHELYRTSVNPELGGLLFFMFLLAFAIKAPLFPFHTWLPDTYTEAPVSTTLILSAVMAKLGVYGMIRFVIPVFPEIFMKNIGILMTLAVIGTIYAGLIALVQKDMKRLIAYSSISHLGYIILGVFAFNLQSLQGSLYHMINHAVSTGALFLLVAFLEERIKTRIIGDTGGLMKKIPVLGTVFMIVMLSSIGLPGLNGFVGEILIFLGVFGHSKIFSALGATGIVIGAAYMLWMFQRVMFGEAKHDEQEIKDINPKEAFIMLPLLAIIIFMGIYPKPFLNKMEPSVTKYVEMVKMKAQNSSYSTVMKK